MIRWDVLCVGIVNLNMVFRPVPMDMMEKDVVLAQALETLCGGDAVNQAMVLSHLGLRAAVSGKQGADAVGATIKRQLEENGVDTMPLLENADCDSGVCTVMVRPDGSRNFLVFRGGTEQFSLRDFDMNLLHHTKAVSIGSMFALKELDGSGVCAILKKARSLGVLTFADMKTDTYNIGYKGIQGVIPHLDYFIPSMDEAAYLSGETSPPKMARRFLKDGAGCVLIKLGGDGVYACAAGSDGFYQRTYNAPVLDTTGAGDNFVAGFIAAMLEGKPLGEGVDFANAVASISVGTLGAHGGVQSRKQVDEFRASNTLIK